MVTKVLETDTVGHCVGLSIWLGGVLSTGTIPNMSYVAPWWVFVE